jgi:hypothetical protein
MGWSWWPSNIQADIVLAAIGFFCAVGLLLAMSQAVRERTKRRFASRFSQPS